MASAVKKYAYISAKFKTRLSSLLSDDFFQRMIRAHSLSDAFQLFRDTEYSDLTEIYQKTGDLKTIERELFKREIRIYADTLKHLDSQLTSFVKTLLLRHEIDTLKNAIRLWFDRKVRTRNVDIPSVYIYKEKIVHEFSVDAVINSESIEQVVAALGGTPYAGIVRSKAENILSEETLFALEVELDRFFYTALLEACSVLDPADRSVAERLLGIEIDMENLNWLIRFKTFYNFPADRVPGLLLPGGRSVSTAAAAAAYSSADSGSMLSSLIAESYPGWESLVSRDGTDSYSRYLLFEHLLKQILEKELARIKGGNPFTIGILLVYFLLKRKESQQILTILNGKFYNLTEDRIKDAL